MNDAVCSVYCTPTRTQYRYTIQYRRVCVCVNQLYIRVIWSADSVQPQTIQRRGAAQLTGMPNLQVEGSVLFALSVPLWTAVRWARSAHGNLPSHRHSLQLAPAKEENPEVIAVLSYWFDGDASHNYKYKWFPSSSRDIQERADAAIAERFETCLRLAAADELGYWGSSLKANIAKILVLGKPD